MTIGNIGDPTGLGAGLVPGVANQAAAGTGATGGAAQSSAAGAATSTGSAAASSQLSNPQLFLQLLIAELKNQDPTNPTSPATIMQETSELSQMEAVNSMTTAISSEQAAVQNEQATSLIGKQVTATVGGVPVVGTVSDVLLQGGTPVLDLGGTQVALSTVTKVGS